MPRGPKGEKRPADVIGAAVMVGRIATGEIDEPGAPRDPVKSAAGKSGGKSRAAKLSREERVTVSKKAAKSRWGTETP
jgi:hypothetical protein